MGSHPCGFDSRLSHHLREDATLGSARYDGSQRQQVPRLLESDGMDSRRKYVFGAFLVLAGAGLFVFVVRPALGPTEGEWSAQIDSDAVPLTQALRYDFRLEDAPQFDAAWAKRRVLYDEEHFATLRERLMAFIEFQVAEYADAKDIFQTGRRPEELSGPAQDAHAALRRAFPAQAEEMITQFRDRIREEAYKASPKVGGGADPDREHFDATYDDVIGNWVAGARARAVELTQR